MFTIFRDFGVLRHFLKYYFDRGITNAICGLHKINDPKHHSDILKTLSLYPHRLFYSESNEVNGERDAEVHNTMRLALIASNEWYVRGRP